VLSKAEKQEEEEKEDVQHAGREKCGRLAPLALKTKGSAYYLPGKLLFCWETENRFPGTRAR